MATTKTDNGILDEQMHERIDALKEDFSTLRDDIKKILQDTSALGSEGGKHVADRALSSSAKVRETVESHPLACIGAALGAGVIAGLMLRR